MDDDLLNALWIKFIITIRNVVGELDVDIICLSLKSHHVYDFVKQLRYVFFFVIRLKLVLNKVFTVYQVIKPCLYDLDRT